MLAITDPADTEQHVSIHLANESLIITLLSALFWSEPMRSKYESKQLLNLDDSPETEPKVAVKAKLRAERLENAD